MTSRRADRPNGPALARARDLIDTPMDVTTPSRLPFAARLFRRAINRGLAHHDEQVNHRLNALADAMQEQEAALTASPLVGRVDELTARLDADSATVSEIRGRELALRTEFGQLNAALATAQEQLYRRLDAAERPMQAMTDHVGELQRSATESMDVLAARLEELRRAVDLLTSESVARPYTSDPDAMLVTSPEGHPTFGYEASGGVHGTYADFEDLFRGPPDMITERLEPYLAVLKDHGPVLDVGCGRGELLTLLHKAGVEARGVDPDASMVERAEQQGLDVQAVDGLTALRESGPDSLGAVVSIQVVEHVSPQEMRELFLAGFDALRPGGVFVAETVNSHSAMALKAFWLDLTHVRPLYPESLILLAREAGFASAYILFPAGSGLLDDDLRLCGEYALVATKA